jgi:Sigma-70, region 4
VRRLRQVDDYPDVDRPRVRGDCLEGPRPCPFVSCKWHLYLDVRRSGSLQLNFPDLEPDQLKETCALDVADRGSETTLDEIGALMNVTRERIRQIEAKAGIRIQRSIEMREHAGEQPLPQSTFVTWVVSNRRRLTLGDALG